MKEEKIAFSIFIFGALLAISIGIYDSSNVQFSPSQSGEYHILSIIDGDGGVIQRTQDNILNNPTSFKWEGMPLVLKGKKSLDYKDNAGNEIPLKTSDLYILLSRDSKWDYTLHMTEDSADNFYYILQRSFRRPSITGEAVHPPIDVRGDFEDYEGRDYDFGIGSSKKKENLLLDGEILGFDYKYSEENLWLDIIDTLPKNKGSYIVNPLDMDIVLPIISTTNDNGGEFTAALFHGSTPDSDGGREDVIGFTVGWSF